MLILIFAALILILIVWGALNSPTFRTATLIVVCTPIAAVVLFIFWASVLDAIHASLH